MWWRVVFPVAGSVLRLEAGNRYCQFSSLFALGNFLSNAKGMDTMPKPSARSFW